MFLWPYNLDKKKKEAPKYVAKPGGIDNII